MTIETVAQDLAQAVAKAVVNCQIEQITEARLVELVKEHGVVHNQFGLCNVVRDRKPKIIPLPKKGTAHRPEGLTHCVFDKLLQAINVAPVLLVGPAGSGKTTIGKQIADAMGLEFYSHGAVTSKVEVMGYRGISGELVRTPFREAFEYGGVFLFDEIDASHPQALLALNSALANGFCDFPDGRVEQHEDFRCIASANTFGRGADRVYVGRNALDGATLDRYIYLEMGYDTDLELSLVDKKYHSYVNKIHVWRQAVEELNIRFVIGTRAIINGVGLFEAGFDMEEVEKSVVFKGLDEDSIVKIKGN